MTAGRYTSKEVELDGLDSLLLLADDLRVLHPGLGVRARCCHDPAHTSASSLGGAAKGLRVGDFDLAHLLLGHLRAALADAERGERDVDSLGVRRNLLLESVHVDNHLGDLGVGEGVRLAARHHHHLLAQRVLDQKLHDASAHVPRRAQHDRRVLRLRLCALPSSRHTRAEPKIHASPEASEVLLGRAISSHHFYFHTHFMMFRSFCQLLP